MKLECSLVSALDVNEEDVNGNLDADEILIDSLLCFGVGELLEGLDFPSDFSDGVFRCAGGGDLCDEELWLLLQRTCTGVVEALPLDDGVLE